MTQSCTLATPPSAVAAISLKLSRAAILRPPPSYGPPPSLSTRTITMNINSQEQQQDNLDGIFKQKRILRSKVRKALKAMDPTLRSHEDNAIQSVVLEAPWFRSCQRLCAYICCSGLREVDTSNLLSAILQSPLKEGYVQVRKKLYVPRNRPIDADGNEREDVLQASDPVDLFLLPGLAFDRSGRRLGRGGGYYDTFLKNYQELAKTRNWKQPLLVALSYSVQILDEGVPVTPHDILVDALVSPAGVIPISPAALDRMRP
ncbi:5-formyltetrahydrofolate cyclo-ligase mitochondrial [Prunus yedoensis var. nudiflora]|uniref:5-formyltetrahydrofolate cyclo-ligase n=1 Tax=Prunus yedoensis var. nudiflora TaxID=2094558 RepID=A0A314YTN4_PRUYE|nr:5-formyltetrahydrofolate cyclo-ligase mitochondrial [Prunus yedoensis var. nudiflora]